MKGFQCLFRHHEMDNIGDMDQEERHRVRTAGAPLCRFYDTPAGCQYGFHCAYSHGMKKKRSRTQSSESFKEKNDAVMETSKEDDEEEEEEEDKCSICFDKPQGTIGLLENCDHVFCMDCISKWRSHRSAEVAVETQRTCPICRKKSFFVVPSSRPLKGKLRESAIESFKLICSTRPCKNFVPHENVNSKKANRSCKFGHNCFYAHLKKDGTDAKPDQKRSFEKYVQRQQSRRTLLREGRRLENLDLDAMDRLFDMYISNLRRAFGGRTERELHMAIMDDLVHDAAILGEDDWTDDISEDHDYVDSDDDSYWANYSCD